MFTEPVRAAPRPRQAHRRSDRAELMATPIGVAFDAASDGAEVRAENERENRFVSNREIDDQALPVIAPSTTGGVLGQYSRRVAAVTLASSGRNVKPATSVRSALKKKRVLADEVYHFGMFERQVMALRFGALHFAKAAIEDDDAFGAHS
jgi:hypothetical protein